MPHFWGVDKSSNSYPLKEKPLLSSLPSRVVYACSMAAVALALAVMAAWFVYLDVLLVPAPVLLQMKFNTCLGILFTGAALSFLQGLPRSSESRIGIVLASLVMVFMGFTIAEYFFHADLHIDQIFIADTGVPQYPGRSSPTAAGCVIVIALVEVLIGLRKWPPIAQLLTLVPVVLGVFILSGYIYGAQALYAVAYYRAVAPATAFGILVLGVGLLCLQPMEGFMRLFWVDTFAGRAARYLTPGALVLPGLLGLMLRLHARFDFNLLAGMVLIVLVNTLMFLLLLWVILSRLHTSELKRVAFQQMLSDNQKRQSQILEAEVRARTHELQELLMKTRAILESSSDGICGWMWTATSTI